MGRPGLIHHYKFGRLARRVGGEALALGHLELTWLRTYENGDAVRRHQKLTLSRHEN